MAIGMSNDQTRFARVGNSPIQVGRFTYGFENIAVRQWGEGAALRVGAFCSIAPSVTVYLGGNHRTDWITTFPFGHVFADELGGRDIQGHPSTFGDVTIGDDVWIGSGVTILSGVSVGSGAVLAANSTVVKDVMAYEVVGGNPARRLKQRFTDQAIERLLVLRWWDLPIESIREIAAELSAPPTEDKLRDLLRRYRP